MMLRELYNILPNSSAYRALFFFAGNLDKHIIFFEDSVV